ncbi:putative RNA-directed DNA polymerase from transposon BS, partial [Araneus ventricosus]
MVAVLLISAPNTLAAIGGGNNVLMLRD